MTGGKPYADIPGTYVMDSTHCMKGYRLNMFCMTLNKAENREAFDADEAAYLTRFSLTPEQTQAVLDRDYLQLLRTGGNIYYLLKIAAHDRKSVQHVCAQMTGVTEDEFKAMMVAGGRSVEGNRYVGEQVEEKT